MNLFTYERADFIFRLAMYFSVPLFLVFATLILSELVR